MHTKGMVIGKAMLEIETMHDLLWDFKTWSFLMLSACKLAQPYSTNRMVNFILFRFG